MEECFHFRPLELETIEAEIATIRVVEKELEEEWRTESLKYEETMTVPHCSHPVARRNYFNPQGVVQDVSLYPYHDFYYPLIDAYDCLYANEEEHPISKEALRPQSDRSTQVRSMNYRIHYPEEENNMELHFEYVHNCFFASEVLRASVGGFLYQGEELHTSPDSVVNCILLETETDLRPTTQWRPAEQPRHLHDGQHEYWSQRRQMFLEGNSLEDDADDADQPVSSKLPREVKLQILLRLLRHALSECQRDYYLALSILTRLSRESALDDVSMLRKVLLVINSECVECGNVCDEFKERDHDCGEWSAFLNGLHLFIGLGITVMTEAHAVTLASYVRSCYLNEFGHRLEESEPLEKQRRARLKRVIAALRPEDGPSSLHIQLVEILVRALGTRAHLERRRCREAISRGTISNDRLGTFLSSYWNCIRTLVNIGDSTVEIIPDNEPYFTLASEAVKNIAYGFMELVSPPSNRVRDTEDHGDYSTYLIPAHTHFYPNVIRPTRYLDLLLQRREQPFFTNSHGQSIGIDSNSASMILDLERPAKVLNTVRSLFIQDMVDIRLSRMGYGDFVVWCGFPLNMEDPIVLWHEYQFPVEEEDDVGSEGAEDSDEDDEPWVRDETGNSLSPSQLRSRYNLCVLVALRAWHAPWTPLLHHTFSRTFRRCMKELFLCTHRLRIPNEVVLRVLPFVDRRWWPDCQAECWSYSCQLDAITKDVHRRKQGISLSDGIGKPLLACSGCRTATYCSKKCMKDDMKAGHRRLCCLPPFKRSEKEEILLLRSVFKEDIPKVLLCDKDTGLSLTKSEALTAESLELGVNDGNVDDDEGSWESWDSNKDDESSTESFNLTETISNYFSKT